MSLRKPLSDKVCLHLVTRFWQETSSFFIGHLIRWKMDYLKAIDVQATMRFYDERDHYQMCHEAVQWNNKHQRFDSHQIHWRLARACLKYYGYIKRAKVKTDDAKTVKKQLVKDMLKYSDETLKVSDCHPMGRKYKAISLWLMAKSAEDDEDEMDLLIRSKKLLDEAIETLPNDHELRQYRGLWHYKASTVNTFERLAIRLLRGIVVPKGTIDEALEDLKIADTVHQTEIKRKNFRTKLLLGLCYVTKGNVIEAKHCWLDCQTLSALEDSIDGDLMEEDVKLLKEKLVNSLL